MFSEFSLTSGATLNPDALVEQWMLFSYLANDNEAGVFNAQDVVGDFTKLLFYNDPTQQPPAVMVLSQGANVYIYIGGTNIVVSGNVMNVLGATQNSSFGGGVFVNDWISRMAQAVSPAIVGSITPVQMQNSRLHFFGHSQGACIGQLLALAYVTQFSAMPADVISVACPKPICGANPPPQNMPRYGFNVTTFGDPVPMVPPNRALQTITAIPGNILTIGTRLSWRHILSTLVLKTDNSFVYVDPTDPYFTLTPSRLANIGSTHPFSVYNQTIPNWWEANFA